jgi:preprotein translocase subunit SecD
MRLECLAAFLLLSYNPAIVSGQSPEHPKCETLQFRFVDESSPSGARRYVDTSQNGEYSLRDTVVLDGRGIDSIRVTAHRFLGDTVWDVSARVIPAAARAWGDATASHVGQRIVVLLGDEIVQTAIIESRIGARTGIRLNATHRVADSLALRARRAVAGCSAS